MSKLIEKQDEWSDLLSIETLRGYGPEPAEEIFGDIDSDKKYELAATWVGDGIHARHIDYPKSSLEVSSVTDPSH